MTEPECSDEKPQQRLDSVVELKPIADEEIELSKDSILELIDYEEDLIAVGE